MVDHLVWIAVETREIGGNGAHAEVSRTEIGDLGDPQFLELLKEIAADLITRTTAAVTRPRDAGGGTLY